MNFLLRRCEFHTKRQKNGTEKCGKLFTAQQHDVDFEWNFSIFNPDVETEAS